MKDYIVDFVCFEKEIVIEVDGGQHYEGVHIILRNEFRKMLLNVVSQKIIPAINEY